MFLTETSLVEAQGFLIHRHCRKNQMPVSLQTLMKAGRREALHKMGECRSR